MGSLSRVAAAAMAASGAEFGMRNRIINGAMSVWQRGTSFSVSTTTVTYGADRWGIYQPSGTGVITQDTDAPAGFKYSLKAVGAGTDILQRIESVNVTDLSGSTVTVSFWIKQTVGAGAGSISAQLQYAGSADNWSAPTVISTQTITPTAAWAQYSLTFVGLPSNVTNGLALNIFPTSGGSSSTFFVTGIQLEKGPVATPFEFRPYGTELALCQRYYQTDNAENTYLVALGYYTPYFFKVSMRAAPTVVITATSGTGSTVNIGKNGFFAIGSGAAASASVTASAEL